MMKRSGTVFPTLALVAIAAASIPVLSAEPSPAASGRGDDLAELRSEIVKLRALVEDLQRRIAMQDATLRRLQAPAVPSPQTAPGSPVPPTPAGPGPSDLERELARELGPPAQSAREPQAPVPPAGAATAGSGQGQSETWSPTQPITIAGGAKNFVNLSLDALATGGGSTSQDVTTLQTGGHDPAQRGVTIQNIEAVLDGAVDPYFRGQANLIWLLDSGGETVTELEEAYLTSTSLPHNLQLKAGTFFNEFGRLNAQHPHAWEFVDQPLVNGRFLGPDGLRGPGARLSWLMPTPFYAEAFLTVQDSQGETAVSFRNTPGEEIFGRPVLDRPVRTFSDMLLCPRLAASFDLSDTRTLVAGLGGLFGPNGTGQDTRTRIYGADVFWKWKPTNALAGFPFVKWQTEAMYRSYDAGEVLDESGEAGPPVILLPAETLRDWGAYSQLLWGFRRGWVVGLRADYVSGTDEMSDPDPTRFGRLRLSPNLTWYPTEFSKIRAQLNQDRLDGPDGARNEQSLWLQVEFILGAHAAHKF